MTASSNLDWSLRAEQRYDRWHRDSKQNKLSHILTSCMLTASSWLIIGRAKVVVKPSLVMEAKKKKVSFSWRPASSIVSMLSTAIFVDLLMVMKTKPSWTGNWYTRNSFSSSMVSWLATLVFASVVLKFEIRMSSWTLLSHLPRMPMRSSL